MAGFFLVKGVIFLELMLKNEIDDVYQLFENSFVPAELRPYQWFVDLYNSNKFKIYIEKQEQTILGAIIVWEFNDFAYLENFAVNQEIRGQGLGGKILEEIKNIYADVTIVLEVEKVYDELSKRRIEFYQRHDFKLNPWIYIQPPLRQESSDVKLHLMSYLGNLDEERYRNIKETLFETVYKIS